MRWHGYSGAVRRYREFSAGPDDGERRFDRLVRRLLPAISLPEIYKAIRTGAVRMGGRKASPSTRVSIADTIEIAEELLGAESVFSRPAPDSRGLANPDPGLFLLETENLLFAAKPRGMLTHGAGGLDGLVRERYRDSIAASLSFVPGPLHRLDRNTSGVVACSRTIEGARVFSAMLREGRLGKRYLALLRGALEEPGEWIDLLGRDRENRLSSVVSAEKAVRGRPAETRFIPLVAAKDATLALVTIGTGQTHQIRAQAAWHGHPLVGDAKYGGGASSAGYLLHAWRLEFPEPPFRDVPARVEAPLPIEASPLLDGFFGGAWRDALVAE